jgi:hypothetical protein
MKCLVDGCERSAKSRGLCSICYQTARNKVSSGITTWSEFEKLGMALPAQHRGRNAPKAISRSSRPTETL